MSRSPFGRPRGAPTQPRMGLVVSGRLQQPLQNCGSRRRPKVRTPASSPQPDYLPFESVCAGQQRFHYEPCSARMEISLEAAEEGHLAEISRGLLPAEHPLSSRREQGVQVGGSRTVFQLFRAPHGVPLALGLWCHPGFDAFEPPCKVGAWKTSRSRSGNRR